MPNADSTETFIAGVAYRLRAATDELQELAELLSGDDRMTPYSAALLAERLPQDAVHQLRDDARVAVACLAVATGQLDGEATR